MKRWIISATVAALALVGMLVPAQQASAAARFIVVSNGACQAGYLCAYPYLGGGGRGVGFYGSEPYWANADAATGVHINNWSLSWKNQGLSSFKPTVTLFDYAHAGEKICLPNDARVVDAPQRLWNKVSANLWDWGCR